MSTAQAMVTVEGMLEKWKPQIAQRIPRHLNVDRVCGLALGAIRKNPSLAACDSKSLVGAVVRASQLGLEIDDERGLAYLVPFKREATLIVGYKGFLELAYRSQKVLSLQAVPVFEGDEFDYERGLNERLHHIPKGRWDAEGLQFVYAICRLTANPSYPIWDVLDRDRIEQHRARSRAKDSGPWVTDYIAMAQKTAIRVIQKWCPKSIEMEKAIHYDEMNETERGQRNQDALDADYEEVTSKPSRNTIRLAEASSPQAQLFAMIAAAETVDGLLELRDTIEDYPTLTDEARREAEERISRRIDDLEKE